MGGQKGQAVEVANTVLRVAHLTWSALDHHHLHHHHPNSDSNSDSDPTLENLLKENKRLRDNLEQILKLLPHFSSSPSFPSHVHEGLVAAVDSNSLMAALESQCNVSVNGTKTEFPSKEPTEADLESAGYLINTDQEDPTCWVWISDEMVPGTVEERNGLDNEDYIIVSEEHVVDGVANVIARCVLSNPKLQKLTPEQLQKTVTKSLGGTNKVEKMLDIWHAGKLFYGFSTWGLAFTGLYQSRGALKLAAHAVHKTTKLVLKAL